MADTLRIIRRTSSGKVQPLLDLNNGSTVQLVRDTLAITPPERRQQMSESNRRYGGAVLGNETHGNGTLGASWYICDPASKDNTLTILENFLVEMERLAKYERWIEWRPQGSSRSNFYKLMAPGNVEPKYRWIVWQSTNVIEMATSFQIAPLAYGDPMSVHDDFLTFNTSRTEDWLAGPGSLGDLIWSNGWQKTVDTQLVVHHDKGYNYTDGMVYVEFNPGGTVGSGQVGAVLNWQDDNNYLYADVSGTTNVLRIMKCQGGTHTQLASTAFTPLASTRYWLLFRRHTQGSVSCAVHTGTTRPEGAGISALASLAYVLTATEKALFSNGKIGFRMGAVDMDTWRVKRVDFDTFVYRSLSARDHIKAEGTIPGTAPALMDVTFEVSPTGSSALWGVLGWMNRNTDLPWPALVAKSDFESNTSGWSTAIVTGHNTASATSITRITSQSKSGLGSGQIVTTATDNAGVNFALPGNYEAGKTYTAELWVRSSAATGSYIMRLGSTTSGANSANLTFTPTWTRITATWTPSTTGSPWYVSFRQTGAVAQTFEIDELSVWQGDAPAGQPMFGKIEARDYDSSESSSGWSSVSDTSASSDQVLSVITSTNSGPRSVAYKVDPYYLLSNGPDPFSGGEMDVEIWSRINFSGRHLNMKVTPSMYPSGVPSAAFYTKEYGLYGKLINTPRSLGLGGYFRVWRLGTFTVPVPDEPSPYLMKLEFDYLPGSQDSLQIDWVMLVPARQRMASPSGKADVGAGVFARGPGLGTKVKSDLSAYISSGTNPAGERVWTPTPGPGGALLEVPPGDGLELAYAASTRMADEPAPLWLSSDAEFSGQGLTLDITPRWFLTRS